MMILSTEQRRALLYALGNIQTTLGREEIGDLRDVLIAILDPAGPEGKKFIEYQLWLIEEDKRQESDDL